LQSFGKIIPAGAGKKLPVCGVGHVGRPRPAEHSRDGVGQGLIYAALPVGVHAHVNYKDAVRGQMFSDQSEKFPGGHLEGDGYVLIGVHHYHVVFFPAGLQKSPAVVGDHVLALRQGKVFLRQRGDLLVYLHAGDRGAGEIPAALCGKGAGAVSQDEHAAVLLRQSRGGGGRQGVIIVHAGEPVGIHLHGLHAEKDVGGQYGAVRQFLYLKIIIHGLPLVAEGAVPEGKAVRSAQNAAGDKQDDG